MQDLATNQTQAPAENKPASLKSMLSQDNVKKRFEEILGEKASGFISSVINTVGQNKLLQTADPNSIIMASAMAATLDLPINQNLGFAWIVPYKGKAQFQLGWKGFIQLALRTGQYSNINVIPVRAGQIKSVNPLKENYEFDFENETGEIVGYAAYFRLVTGFEKTVYWNVGKVREHAQRYSKSFKDGPWQTHFHEMAMKTVLKNTISQYGIMSIEMQKAVVVDQAAIKDEQGTPEYVDNNETDQFTTYEEVNHAAAKIATETTTNVEGDLKSNLPTGNQL